MLFCSPLYLAFFLTVFALHWALPWHRARVALLVVASFAFYATFNEWLAVLVCVSTAADYLVARGLDASASPRLRRLLLAASVVGNLGLLCYFKYVNFFLRSAEDGLRLAGCSASLPVLRVLLPVGISFYTFEAINYTVDVYRRRLPAEKNLFHFLLFILFFPHLVAGPIVRARDFLPQIARPKRWSWPRAHLGVQFFALGLFKKLAVADRLALFADPVFGDPHRYGSAAAWVAMLAYAVQVYCDFSGYSDMAIGSAHLLGYKLAKNFDMPYLAPNIAEFWRRWHISLSTWLRDYLFIPLGGSRGGRWRTCRNLLLTMTLGGLWHGAAWPYVVFGALQGLLLSAHRCFRDCCGRLPRLESALRSGPGTALRVATTFLAFCLTLLVFRAATLADGATLLRRLFVHTRGARVGMDLGNFWAAVALVAVCHALAAGGLWRRWAGRLPAPVLGVGYGAAMTLALLLVPDLGRAFIYFQF
ncbi:MAG TPA: MBOAT family O-acyltransferase [Gemmataceae bacterium]|jgi:alginate O-acetyltransferase complex protein AlgI|nr:MBOAT family O-acyltransferase [Gemmataceae bacterium]